MWKCPKCGRSFKKENQGHYCGKAPETVEDYIDSQDEDIRGQLRSVRKVLIGSLHGATEKKSWSMPTYWKGHNIIHFAAQGLNDLWGSLCPDEEYSTFVHKLPQRSTVFRQRRAILWSESIK